MDEIIWAHIIKGDVDAYSSLYVEYFRKLFNYGKKFTQDELVIEDAIQDVFLDFWNKKEKLAEVRSISSYLFSSFRYRLFHKIKAAKKILSEDRLTEEPEFSAEINFIDREADQAMYLALQAAINNLTPRQREAVFLRFYEGLSYEEVAEVLNISTKATYKIMARSLASLKDRLLIPLTSIIPMLKIIW